MMRMIGTMMAVTTLSAGYAASDEGHAAAKVWCVVLGKGDYLGKSDLPGMAERATRIRETLIGAGIPADHIELLVDDPAELQADVPPSAPTLRWALRRTVQKTQAGDWVVVFALCHGKLGKLHLGDDVDLETLQDELFKSNKALNFLFVLQACRAAGEGSVPYSFFERSETPALKPSLKGKTSIWLWACQAGELAFGTANFAESVAEGFQGPADDNKDGRLTAAELFGYAQRENREQRQRPVLEVWSGRPDAVIYNLPSVKTEAAGTNAIDSTSKEAQTESSSSSADSEPRIELPPSANDLPFTGGRLQTIPRRTQSPPSVTPTAEAPRDRVQGPMVGIASARYCSQRCVHGCSAVHVDVEGRLPGFAGQEVYLVATMHHRDAVASPYLGTNGQPAELGQWTRVGTDDRFGCRVTIPHSVANNPWDRELLTVQCRAFAATRFGRGELSIRELARSRSTKLSSNQTAAR